MSASREKKKRQEFFAGGGMDPKAARAAEQRAAEKKAKILYSSLAIIFVVVAVFLLVYNSGIIQRNQTAVTIDGEKYTVADVSFYYQDAYRNFLATYGTYASIFGLDTTQSLKNQSYSEDQTWDDYFKEQAVTTMKFVHALLPMAEEEGMTLGDEELETFDATVESLQSEGEEYGYNYKTYLKMIYGAAMTPEIYEANLKDQLLAGKYATAYSDSISFTDEEIQAYYEENKNTYDTVDAEYVSISGSASSTTDEDGNTVAATEEEQAAAMEEAKETAEAILAAYEEGGDLEALAEEYGATYTGNEEMTYSSTYVYGDWFFDEARAAGDTAVLEDDTYNRYFVAVFHGRQQEDALDYNVRHILITADSFDVPEGSEVTDEMIEGRAQEILDSWDGTEEGFAALAEEYSQDSGSKDNGGLYENVTKGSMVSEFEDWCYEPGRRAGDTGIVASSYGQHIMYFVGYGETPYWYSACESAMTSDAYSQWQTELIDSVTAEVNEGAMASIG